MYFGADYYPEHWVFPYDGTAEEPESRWDQDAQLMEHVGMNVVRMGEFCWGLCEREEGKYDFAWLRRAMDVFAQHGVKIVLATPTAAPPVWLLKKHPEILPLDETGQPRHEGTRRAYCMNSDIYWDYSKKFVRAMAESLGDHPDMVAWQIDNGVGRHNTEYAFNPETRRDWIAWLKAKYETVDKLNEAMGLRFWGQVVNSYEEVPCRCLRPPRTTRRSSRTGGAFPATRAWPSSACRWIFCARSRRRFPPPPPSAPTRRRSTTSTSPRRWTWCRWTATPPPATSPLRTR